MSMTVRITPAGGQKNKYGVDGKKPGPTSGPGFRNDTRRLRANFATLG